MSFAQHHESVLLAESIQRSIVARMKGDADNKKGGEAKLIGVEVVPFFNTFHLAQNRLDVSTRKSGEDVYLQAKQSGILDCSLCFRRIIECLIDDRHYSPLITRFGSAYVVDGEQILLSISLSRYGRQQQALIIEIRSPSVAVCSSSATNEKEDADKKADEEKEKEKRRLFQNTRKRLSGLFGKR